MLAIAGALTVKQEMRHTNNGNLINNLHTLKLGQGLNLQTN